MSGSGLDGQSTRINSRQVGVRVIAKKWIDPLFFIPFCHSWFGRTFWSTCLYFFGRIRVQIQIQVGIGERIVRKICRLFLRRMSAFGRLTIRIGLPPFGTGKIIRRITTIRWRRRRTGIGCSTSRIGSILCRRVRLRVWMIRRCLLVVKKRFPDLERAFSRSRFFSLPLRDRSRSQFAVICVTAVVFFFRIRIFFKHASSTALLWRWCSKCWHDNSKCRIQ